MQKRNESFLKAIVESLHPEEKSKDFLGGVDFSDLRGLMSANYTFKNEYMGGWEEGSRSSGASSNSWKISGTDSVDALSYAKTYMQVINEKARKWD